MILCYFLQSADRSEENIAHGKSAATSDDNCISQEKNDDGKWKDYIHHTLECTYYIHEITSSATTIPRRKHWFMPITQLKLGRASLVLGWETIWE